MLIPGSRREGLVVSTQRKGMMFWARHILQSIYNKESSLWGFPGDSVVKPPPANAGDAGLIPGSGRSPGGGNGNPLQCSCLEHPWTQEPGRLQNGTLQPQVPGAAKHSDTAEHACTYLLCEISSLMLLCTTSQRRFSMLMFTKFWLAVFLCFLSCQFPSFPPFNITVLETQRPIIQCGSQIS